MGSGPFGYAGSGWFEVLVPPLVPPFAEAEEAEEVGPPLEEAALAALVVLEAPLLLDKEDALEWLAEEMTPDRNRIDAPADVCASSSFFRRSRLCCKTWPSREYMPLTRSGMTVSGDSLLGWRESILSTGGGGGGGT